MAAKLVVTYWRDIPSMVSAQAGRNRHSGMLDERFEKDIDRAAMVAGLVGSDDYLTQWRREAVPCGDDLEAVAAAAVERIQAAYPRERVNSIVLNGGFDPVSRSTPSGEPSVPSGPSVSSEPAADQPTSEERLP